jgi:hypothetical protein
MQAGDVHSRAAPCVGFMIKAGDQRFEGFIAHFT